MYNSSKRKQPAWLVLSIIIIVLAAIVIWLLHNRHVKQEQLAANPSTVQVEKASSSPASVPATSNAQDGSASAASTASTASTDQSATASADQTSSHAGADVASADAADSAQTIQNLQAQVQSLQQALSQAQAQLQSGQGAQGSQRTQKALKAAKKDVVFLQSQVKKLKKQVSAMRQLSNDNQNYVAKLQVENEKLRSLLAAHGIAIPEDVAPVSNPQANASSNGDQDAQAATQDEASDGSDTAADTGSETATDTGADNGQEGDQSGVPVVAIVSEDGTPAASNGGSDEQASDQQAGAQQEAASTQGTAAPSQEVPAKALPALIQAESGALDYRVDVAHLDSKLPVNTPVTTRYVLQYQLVTGQNVFKVIGRTNNTVQTVTRLQGQFSYPTAATPIKLRVVITGPKGVIYDATYPIRH